jgi:hypothetical protein
VIIVDEYAELTDEAPAAMNDTDAIARLGRAVAVTLVAATQRPTQKAMGDVGWRCGWVLRDPGNLASWEQQAFDLETYLFQCHLDDCPCAGFASPKDRWPHASQVQGNGPKRLRGDADFRYRPEEALMCRNMLTC